MGKVSKRRQQRELKERTASRRKRREGGIGYLCPGSGLCFQFDVRVYEDEARLQTVEMYDPDGATTDLKWVSVPLKQLGGPGKDKAIEALKKKALDLEGHYRVDQCSGSCSCVMPKKMGRWTYGYQKIELTVGFSLPSPNPPPARLRYRVTGTVEVKTRLTFGTCYETI